MSEHTLREAMSIAAREMVAQGLNKGTAGNIGCRVDSNTFLVTPSALPVEDMQPEHMVLMDFDGTPLTPGKPSSEWRFHRDILQARPELQAVVHCHSPYATTLACQRRDIPAFHYMIALAGGDSIRCAPYQLFGTEALSNSAVTALENRQACLLANHGQIAVGGTLSAALGLAIEVESLCQVYWQTLQGGKPVLLSASEMAAVFQQFHAYRNPH